MSRKLWPIALCAFLVGCQPKHPRLDKLRVMHDEYPRVFFFRAAEGYASNPKLSYEQWDTTFSRLMGIEGKCLDEEIPGRSVRNVPFFTQFKQQHPGQLVLLHYNGNARDPRDATPDFFAGHWIYHNGATITGDVPAEKGETLITVSDATLFKTEMGRFRDKNEDIALCALDADGKPNWHESEQVQLLAIDAEAKTLRVKRGCYGTTPRAFRAGKSYAAAHVTEGPWGLRNHLMWFYNYSTRSPRDKQGRTCADVLVADLVRHFGPGGALAAFDGLEFDVLHHTCGRPGSARRGPDCDADGQADWAWLDGATTYGVGVVEFCRQLRAALGEDRIILADGHSEHNQRAFGLLNGIESEGWPTLSDWHVRDWSGGLNRHLYWNAFGRRPAFHYVNHKFVTRGEKPGQTKRPDVPWHIHRLVFAACLFTDAAICYAYAPPREDGERFGIWDELRKGTEHQLGWLGKPLGPAIRLAERHPDLLARGNRRDGPSLRLVATAKAEGSLRFRMAGVPCDGPDLTVAVTARAEPMRGYPPEVARRLWVGLARPDGCLIHEELPETGMCLRGATETELDRSTGASCQWRPRARLGEPGETHDAYFAHPPYKQKTGYTFWTRDVGVPLQGSLTFFTGMGPKSPERSDGVLFRVLIAELKQGEPGAFTPIFEHTQRAWAWQKHTVPLAKWGAKSVRLKFVADAGPKDNSTTDHASWGDAWVLPSDGFAAVTLPVRHMTWVGGKRFTSAFTFTDVRSRRVDLEFEVEGVEPVWIEEVRAYAHTDAIVREFERGAVLANPSPRPYTFDLAKLFPGKRFRRLRGSSRQDPQTNNGQPVGAPLTLAPKDALFLTRMH